MEQQSFQLYRERTFSEKINDTFALLRSNWRPMLKWYAYFVLPLCIIAGYTNASLFEDIAKFAASSGNKLQAISPMMPLSALLYILTFAISSALLYTLMQFLLKRPDRFQELTPQEVFSSLVKNFGRLLLVGLCTTIAMTLIAAVLILIGTLSASVLSTGAITFLGVVLTIAFILLMFPAYIIPSVYMFEDGIGVTGAIVKGMRLGLKTLGGLILLSIVLSIIVMIISLAFEIPAGIIAVINTFSAGKDAEPSVAMSFFSYLMRVVSMCGNQLTLAITLTGMIIHYGHACEKIDGVATDQSIDSFETL